jgi:serine/threonine-protein kinase HipA
MHQLTLGGKRSEIRRNDLLEFAHSISIKKANALIDQIKAVVGDWTSYAQQAGVGSEQRRAIGRTFFK